MTHMQPKKTAQVVDLFTGRTLVPGHDNHIIRISPENDSFGMLYENDANPGKLFSMKIIGWGMQVNGEVVGLVPWLNYVTACPELNDPLNGHWEGYYNLSSGEIFDETPLYKQLELDAATNYFEEHKQPSRPRLKRVVQEIPDSIGTHAVLTDTENQKLIMIPIFSWRLYEDGSICGMIVDKTKIQRTPVLAGDNCLYSCQEDPRFKYFFQYRIANKIKAEDPDALEAISHLIDS